MDFTYRTIPNDSKIAISSTLTYSKVRMWKLPKRECIQLLLLMIAVRFLMPSGSLGMGHFSSYYVGGKMRPDEL